MSDEWEDLCRDLHVEADGYAADDPVNDYLYRSDAKGFARQPPPADTEALRDRRERAEELRRLWRHRSDRTRKP